MATLLPALPVMGILLPIFAGIALLAAGATFAGTKYDDGLRFEPGPAQLSHMDFNTRVSNISEKFETISSELQKLNTSKSVVF